MRVRRYIRRKINKKLIRCYAPVKTKIDGSSFENCHLPCKLKVWQLAINTYRKLSRESGVVLFSS